VAPMRASAEPRVCMCPPPLLHPTPAPPHEGFSAPALPAPVGAVVEDTRKLLRRVLVSLWERLLPQLSSVADLGLPPGLDRVQLASMAAGESVIGRG
jgi:hypothetical protein